MSNIEEARRALVARILDGGGEASGEQRRAAFDHARLDGPVSALLQKVAEHAFQLTDEDFAVARAAGLSEDQLFELVVCAAVGQATRQHEVALAALESATGGSTHAPRHSR
jgi:alkylhydroperoxidase family enzyme